MKVTPLRSQGREGRERLRLLPPLYTPGVLSLLAMQLLLFPFWKRRPVSPQPNTPRATAPLMLLLTAANQAEADIVVGLLKTHAIPALARVGGAGIAYSTTALQPFAIFVLEPDLSRARAVLAAYRDDGED